MPYLLSNLTRCIDDVWGRDVNIKLLLSWGFFSPAHGPTRSGKWISRRKRNEVDMKMFSKSNSRGKVNSYKCDQVWRNGGLR